MSSLIVTSSSSSSSYSSSSTSTSTLSTVGILATTTAAAASLFLIATYSTSRFACARFAKREERCGTQKSRLLFRRTNSDEMTNTKKKKSNDNAGTKKVMLVISHPDDEAMFFGPTVESLKMSKLDGGGGQEDAVIKDTVSEIKVFCICLSNGNAEGLGQIRAKELKKSTLEVFKMDGCVIADSEDLQDGMDNVWPLEEIANVVHECVQHYSPDVILTFDEKGVSKHPNHVQTHRGVMRFVVEAKLGAIPNAEYTEENVPEVWVLETTPFYRTFMGAMDYWASIVSTTTRNKKKKETSDSKRLSPEVMFCSKNPSLVLKAMRTHATQWVWFRKLYVKFSRYSLMNTLRRIDVGPPPSSR